MYFIKKEVVELYGDAKFPNSVIELKMRVAGDKICGAITRMNYPIDDSEQDDILCQCLWSSVETQKNETEIYHVMKAFMFENDVFCLGENRDSQIPELDYI